MNLAVAVMCSQDYHCPSWEDKSAAAGPVSIPVACPPAGIANLPERTSVLLSDTSVQNILIIKSSVWKILTNLDGKEIHTNVIGVHAKSNTG